MLSGPNAAPRSKLDAELASTDAPAVLDAALAASLTQAFNIDEAPLAFQPNFTHSDFPLHYDIPGSDGFGQCIVTLNVKEEVRVSK